MLVARVVAPISLACDSLQLQIELQISHASFIQACVIEADVEYVLTICALSAPAGFQPEKNHYRKYRYPKPADNAKMVKMLNWVQYEKCYMYMFVS